MAEGWTWVNENAEKWNLSENPGFLRIYSSPYGSGGENLLLRPVAPGDFTIETRVLFEPTDNFQFAGLFIDGGEGNSLALGRAFCDVPENCVGNGIYFDAVIGGEWTGENFATPVNVSHEAYLRLERRGEMVRGLFSYEGITWFEIGTHGLPPDFAVMGVGLTNAQDSFTPEWDIPADFDYFELSEGWGFLPEGFHDYQQGDVPAWECVTGGWAVDPDDRLTDLNVEIAVDGNSLPEWLSAGEYRPDLEEAGLCVDGSCGFSTTMWDKLSFYEPHLVTVNAQDLNSGEWVQLSASPKTLTCRTYDIFSFDPISGEIIQITNLPESDEYNPDWSPNGKKVAHDVIFPDGNYDIYITDTTTGISTQLIGAEHGNDAVWSPNGKWIAFDREMDDLSGIYIVPETGGTPQLIRADAASANWAPNGKRLVFMQPSDGTIRTVPVGEKGEETLIAAEGYNPAWSPDGNWIAYEYNGDIWKVPVNVQGSVFGDPFQVTSLQSDEGQPAWSMDSQTIVYQAGLSQDYDLWSVPASGGAPTWLNGAPEFGDYDPSVAGSDGKIAYASFSPQGQAPRSWIAAFTHDLPVDFWGEGDHTYRFSTFDGWSDDFTFNASANNPRYDGKALLRPWNIWVRAGEGCDMIDRINVLQPTQFHIGWTIDGSYAEALETFAGLHAQVSWDETAPVDLLQHEVFPLTSQVDWWAYACSFTAGPPRMDLRVNYGHDWVESFYEAGHAVTITVYESDLQTVKATAVSNTEPKDFWGGSEGFQTTPEEWAPAPPDLQPGDWVYAEVDNGAVARVQLGEITGQVDVINDFNAGTISAPWIDQPVQVECLDWGSGNDPALDNRDGGWIIPNGAQEYTCSWAGDWDVLPWQDIGVGYLSPDGHWVANAFHFKAWMGFWTYDIPAETFLDGIYQYQFDWYFSLPYEESKVTDEILLTIDSMGADFYDGKVLIGPWLYLPQFAWTGDSCGEVPSIRADQPARFVFGWVNDISMTYEEALEHFNSFIINVTWTGPVSGTTSVQNLSELLPFTTPEARTEYLCSFTEHP